MILLVQDCSEKPQLQPLPANSSISAFGDSSTLGSGVERHYSDPTALQQLSGLEVINASIAGELSSEGLKRLPGLLRRHRPRLVIMTHGGNDVLRGRDSK